VPTIDLPADELAAVTAAIRGVIEDDRYPYAPRLDPLRAALARSVRQKTTADSAVDGKKLRPYKWHSFATPQRGHPVHNRARKPDS
jgi:hypothetical protein